MKNYILVLFLSVSTFGFSQKTDSFILDKEQIIQREVNGLSDFPIYRAYEFQDKSGVCELVLFENRKIVSKKDTLNTKIQAICAMNDHGGFRERWTINDLVDNEEAETNIWFWTKYCSVKDLDGDGYIDPVIVYGTRDENEYIKRVKIITVYKDKKYAIRAVESEFDLGRSFKKDAHWKLLPQKIKTYIDQLVIKLRKEQDLLLKDG
ncbi:M949_RS01915 family surface polysaccharide biosynthesis protein [Flavobacterium sp. ENC]|uniref:M949_RS01915 family surface polysaccharide biosynthesis protein n=1 Tax=Flavobacterium sp. ENC TaxID=2897330 RepID=UPI001E3EABF0|nr:hypothetical protein [Flavobacterium sp. ENC]MCD0466305.1 hypothetical protein [Flavobacterium sp. ENC]